MKTNYFLRQIFLIMNQCFVILFSVVVFKAEFSLDINASIQLYFITLFLFDAYYISYTNVKNSKTISYLSLLLICVSWQFLLEITTGVEAMSTLSQILRSPISLATLFFMLDFLFQAQKYKYKKPIQIVMTLICVITSLSRFVSIDIFYILLRFELLITFLIILFIFAIHHTANDAR